MTCLLTCVCKQAADEYIKGKENKVADALSRRHDYKNENDVERTT
jgi:hypothetical protein